MTEDQDAQMEIKVKRLRSSTNICHHVLSMHEANPISLLGNQIFAFSNEGLALQDYNNKAPDTCS